MKIIFEWNEILIPNKNIITIKNNDIIIIKDDKELLLIRTLNLKKKEFKKKFISNVD